MFKMNLSNLSAKCHDRARLADADHHRQTTTMGTPRASTNNFVVDEADGTANFYDDLRPAEHECSRRSTTPTAYA